MKSAHKENKANEGFLSCVDTVTRTRPATVGLTSRRKWQ